LATAPPLSFCLELLGQAVQLALSRRYLLE
jgi:hypothetical protein